MGTLRPMIPLLVLLSIVLLFSLPNSPAVSIFGGPNSPLDAPLIQRIPPAFQIADAPKSLGGNILLELVAVFGVWVTAMAALSSQQRQQYTTYGIPTPRQFILVCMHDRDGKKR